MRDPSARRHRGRVGHAPPIASAPSRPGGACPAPAPAVICPDFGDTPSPFPVDLPPGETAAVGTIPGSFSVSPAGQLVYSMSLALPPGRAGMEPHLAITYDSNGGNGNGILGMGFSVSGLSAITRCPANVAQDGRKRGVAYDGEDPVCLDGRRLIRPR